MAPLTAAQAPTPVAIPWARLAATRLPADRLLAAVDLAYATARYAALVQLASWLADDWEAALARMDGAHAAALQALEGGKVETWWALARAMATANGSAWPAEADAAVLRQLDRSRLARHHGVVLLCDAGDAAEVQGLAERLVAACGPLLSWPLWRQAGETRRALRGPALPPLEGGQGRIVVHVPGAEVELAPFLRADGPLDATAHRDLLVYERLVGQAALYDDGERFVERAPPSLVASLVGWRRAQTRAEAAARVSSRNLGQALRLATHQALARQRLGRPPWSARRPEADQLSAWAPEGHRALQLVGPSGVGKSHLAHDWLAAAGDQVLPLWLPAGHWPEAPFDAWLGALVTGTPVAPRPDALRGALSRGCAVVLDGLDEARAPAAVLAAVIAGLASAPAPVRLVITTRRAAPPGVPAHWWWTTPDGGGRVSLGLLDPGAARSLWEGADPARPDFSALPPHTQQLLRLPLMAALARQIGALSGPLSPDALFHAFIGERTTDLQRGLLQQVAAECLAGCQPWAAARDTGEGGLAAAARGVPAVAEALDGLVALGLLQRTTLDDQPRYRFGFDRLLGWWVDQLVTARCRADRADGQAWDEADWTAAFAQVAGSPALAAGVAQACARWIADHPAPVRALTSAALRPDLARATWLAALERSPRLGRQWLARAWRQPRQRPLLLEVAAEAGIAARVVPGLADRRTRAQAVAILPQLARRDAAGVAAAVEGFRLAQVRRPWRRPGAAVGLATALLHLHFGEGAGRAERQAFRTSSRALAQAALGVHGRGGWALRALQALLVPVVARYAAPPPGDIPDMPFELRRFLRIPAAQRARWRPLVELFADRATPAQAAPVLAAAAELGDVGPMLFWERALIAAALRPQTAAAALELAFAQGRAGQRAEPVRMVGQSAMYVHEVYLTRRPQAPDWDRRFDAFDRLAHGWLDAAPDRRYPVPSGRRYKSLFAAAHLLLWHQRTGAPTSPFVRRIWQQALQDRDPGLVGDLCNDLLIVAVTRGQPALALQAAAPLWRLRKLGGPALNAARAFLAALDRRIPAETREALAAVGSALAPWAADQRSRPGAPGDAAMAMFLNFDDAFVLDDALRGRIAEVLDAALEAPDLAAVIRVGLRTLFEGLVA